MMTLVLIWLTLSVVIGACVCRLLTLAGPGNPEKVIYTVIWEAFSRIGSRSLAARRYCWRPFAPRCVKPR